MQDDIVGIVAHAIVGGHAVAKRLFGEHEYLSRTEAVAKEMIEEEVVKLVRAHKVFRLLPYVSLFIGRYQLWRYWRGNDIVECRRRLVVDGLRHELHKVGNQRLRY